MAERRCCFDRFWLFVRSLCVLSIYQDGCEFDAREGVLISWNDLGRRDVYALPDTQLHLLRLIANPAAPVVMDCHVDEAVGHG
jgi:hypothetical protein